MIKLFNREPKPVAEGYLPEEDGHKIYWARYGNIKGPTVLMFHGGPGGGKSRPRNAKSKNLKKYNVVLFDQRGCGKSEPFGEIKNNNTQKTLSDVKRLLDFLDIEKVILQGTSWGSTLSLLFTEKYPKLVNKIIVTDIFLDRKEDNKWTYEHMQHVYPDFYENMIKDKPKNKSLANYYYDLAMSSKISNQKKVFNNFLAYESTIGNFPVEKIIKVKEQDLKEVRIFLHYLKNNYFLRDNEILKNIKSIENKQCLIIHNRLDLLCPIIGAYDLHKAMKKSKLIINPKLGHGIEWNKEAKQQIAEFLEK